MLVVHDQIVEDAHGRPQCGAGGLLVKRHARGAVEKRDLQNAAGFLRRCRRRGAKREQQQARGCQVSQSPLHNVSSHCSRAPLNTPIIGRTAAVASSCSDMLAGLSKCEMLRVPTEFCATAELDAMIAISN